MNMYFLDYYQLGDNPETNGSPLYHMAQFKYAV